MKEFSPFRFSKNTYWQVVLLLILTIAGVFSSCSDDERLNKVLKKVNIGDTYEVLRKEAGEASTSLEIDYWEFRNGHYIEFNEEGIVYDYYINTEDQGLQQELFKRKKERKQDRQDKRDKVMTKKTLLDIRIGMTRDEVFKITGEPIQKKKYQIVMYKKHQVFKVENGIVFYKNLHAHSSLEKLDKIRLNFDAKSLTILNISLAFIMFGVALEIKLRNFKEIVFSPKPILVGVFSQFFLLPLMTFLLVLIIRPTPSVAMGMILVAACPGGNISNFISSLAKGNIELSVTLTAIATIAAIFMTPLNFTFWGSMYSQASDLVMPIKIDPYEMLKTVLILLGFPVLLGISFAYKFPKLTGKITGPFKKMSIVFFMIIIIASLANNFSYFLEYIHLIVLIVLLHNAIALLTGYSIASVFKLKGANRRAISIETGIQNSGLGLVLIFNPRLFDGLGGMAFIAAWWGIWHILAGLGIASIWSKKQLN